MHENMNIKPKRGIKWSYQPWGRKTLQKLRKKTTKNLSAALPSRRERERKSWKTFENDVWNSQRTIFKKLETRCLIDRKTGSINRTTQRLTEFLKQDFDWSKIRLDQSKFLKNSFFGKINLIFENLPQSIEYKKKKKCMSMRWNALPKHKF